MRPLNAAVLADPPPGLAVPTYDRTALEVGIVHFGVGGFHRAHQAMYVDRLLGNGLGNDWAICGVGVMPQDEHMRDVLEAQEGLYVLMEKRADGSRNARVVGSIVEYLFAPDDPDRVLRQLSEPPVRLVSLTITEGGYPIDPASGEFVPPPDAETSVFELIVEALRRRRDLGTSPFAVLSCDNIQHNGAVARRSCVGYARGVDAELAQWIDDHVAFPDSMVDRITPVTTDDDRAEVAERFGIVDRWPVVCESFEQWVVEDRFPAGRPPYEQAGVQMVGDVEPYELMKLRLLNASHQAMCYLGYLSGYRYVHEAMGDPKIRRLLVDYMEHEGGPTVPPVPGVDLQEYQATLIERFANPEIKDTLARLCAESSDRIPKWLLPVVRENLARGRDVTRSAAVVASWARYAEGVDEQGEPITVVDQLASQLVPIARRQRRSPAAFIEQRQLFGDLADHERFAQPYLKALSTLHTAGAQALLGALNA